MKAQVATLLVEAEKADNSECFNGKVDYRAANRPNRRSPAPDRRIR